MAFTDVRGVVATVIRVQCWDGGVAVARLEDVQIIEAVEIIETTC